MRVMLFDYGAGNLHSLEKAIASAPDVSVRIETDPAQALAGDVLVLPGVGAFGAAAARLAPGCDAMRQAILGGLPTLGICLGMQLLFDASDEGSGVGLGVLAGRVTRLEAVRVPQIGWNTIEVEGGAMGSLPAPLPIAYYANSYVCRPDDRRTVSAWSTHEADTFPAVVSVANTLGVQFHPEKSSAGGVSFLHAFLERARHAPGVG